MLSERALFMFFIQMNNNMIYVIAMYKKDKENRQNADFTV